uniref:NADH-ubiquinone oxidoreductase chain 4L n=1 Tax=Curculionoidea sp. 14 KM-2017 TaxID=2219397 RepID=A0A346RG38_9CUCU|nr:NADH dehydrogenase subunit 4L [Curculionoidea sp. 14 KM-2017]
MAIYMILVNILFFSGLLSFSLNRKHFLIMLLSLEFLVISIYLFLNMNFSFLNNEFFFLMIFLTMSVCEGALGLSILVSLIRSFGNDYIMSMFTLW